MQYLLLHVQVYNEMTNLLKEPSIKLIPSDPMTNTILIIYCVSSTGASVPYKSSWRRLHPKKNRVQQIRQHNGSSYRCSPLDLDYLIEATVYYQHQNAQVSRIIQSNVVKVSRELKERRMYMRQPLPCKISLDQIPLEIKVSLHEGTLHFTPTDPSYSHLSLLLPVPDLNFETQTNQLTCKFSFKQKPDDFLNFVSQIIGWRPQLRSNQVTLSFGSDLNRDIILLGVAETMQRIDRLENQGLNFPISVRNIADKSGKITSRKMDRSKNKSQISVSPTNSFKEKQMHSGKVEKKEMKRSFNKFNQVFPQKKEENLNSPPDILNKPEEGDKPKQREYLNVFEDDDLEFLNQPIQKPEHTVSGTNLVKPQTYVPAHRHDHPSINLRDSFDELQKSFHSHVNDEVIDRAFGDSGSTKKLQDEIESLKRENESLKKQNQSIPLLTKENHSLRRKYLQMKEEINRLEMERKVILTDKLRCEVNWHKQIQEKEQIKKELDYLRQMAKTSQISPAVERSKSHSFKESAEMMEKQSEGRQPSRSPNRTLYK